MIYQKNYIVFSYHIIIYNCSTTSKLIKKPVFNQDYTERAE